ncbi:M42 family metallopeptidase [Proteinivorax hydrogeniformans]|uniref:M42 family metallopeptidase n=1 Tax=Proteinivorax hydrogeniformans TaxID=1826727 RepID=A0AAU8HPA2_9FIRM
MDRLMKDLSEGFGPSGHEKMVTDYIKSQIMDFCDEVKTDKLGNLIALKKGKSDKKIMYAAHVDEIGILVTFIDDNGFLRFTNIGGLSPHLLLGQRIKLECGVTGVIGTERITDISKLNLEKMFIDIGANSKEEAEELVSIGEVGTFCSNFEVKQNHYIGKALDDRAGCAVLIEALKDIKNPDHNLYFVFTTQEEVGLRGATTASYSINPDLGIAIDVTAVGDTPKARRMAVSLGKGPAIKVKDNSIMVNPMIKDMMIKKAQDNNIPYQLEVLEFGGTDSGAIHLSREGAWAGVISLPCRYIHTSNEMLSKDDVKNAVKLLKLTTEFDF